MVDFCIPKQLAETLKEAARRGEIDIAKMYDMTSGERHQMFKKWMDESTAGEVNAGFERAMISDRQTALKDWASAVFTGEEKKTRVKDVLDKIDSLNEKGLLTPEGEKSFLSDLVASELGATVTEDEAKTISEKATKLQSLFEEKSEFGTPTVDYFKAKRDMENYLNSLTPSSRLRVFSSTIGRATMLLSVKSPLLNIESNSVQGLLTLAERRILHRTLSGANNGYAVRYMKFVNKVFGETGYDISRMESLDTGRRNLGEDVVNTQGKGNTRRIGRFYEDVVFNKMLSAPDVAFSSAHFADSANMVSSRFAAKEGLKGDARQGRALEIFKDATRIDPQTVQGQAVRKQAIADATYATYTNKSVYSDLGLGIRKLFNIPSKDLRIGDQLMPFVKTPANVIGAGIENSGILLPVDATLRMAKVLKGLHEGQSLREAAGGNFAGFGRVMIRAGLGLTFAYLLSTLFQPDDFVGEYPTSQKEQKLFELKQATANSVKINGKWVSLDYFGPLGAPLVGFLYAKKYGKDLPDQVMKYYEGVGKQVAKIPGFDEFYNTIQALQQSRPQGDETLTTALVRAGNNVFDFISARVIPGIVADVAKATDPTDRKVNYQSVLDKLEAKIPGLRQNLPEKYNIFGETLKTEGWNTVFFGARVKTAGDGKLIDELIRLESDSNLPALTDMAQTDKGKILKAQIGADKFDSAMKTFGKYFKQDLEDLIQSSDYIDAEDDGARKKLIDATKRDTFEYVLDEYHYLDPTDEEKKKILGK